MKTINPEEFEYSLRKIEDGFVFEKFIGQFLSQRLGYEFIPAGGIRDRGIDGFEHVLNQSGYETYIYQISIEKDYKNKIERSIEKLIDNEIKLEKFYYITNQECKEKEKLIDNLFNQYRIPITIYDIKWLASNVNHSPGTINVYGRFIEDYFHEYIKPGKT